jgi:hypothetical protein
MRLMAIPKVVGCATLVMGKLVRSSFKGLVRWLGRIKFGPIFAYKRGTPSSAKRPFINSG